MEGAKVILCTLTFAPPDRPENYSEIMCSRIMQRRTNELNRQRKKVGEIDRERDRERDRVKKRISRAQVRNRALLEPM
jgi:hypothetical protein